MESLLSYASISGSVFSTIATFYFWLVRARGERPNLKPYAVDREFFLGNSSAEKRQITITAAPVRIMAEVWNMKGTAPPAKLEASHPKRLLEREEHRAVFKLAPHADGQFAPGRQNPMHFA